MGSLWDFMNETYVNQFNQIPKDKLLNNKLQTPVRQNAERQTPERQTVVRLTSERQTTKL